MVVHGGTMDFLKFSRTKKSVEKQAAPVAQLDRAPDYGSQMIDLSLF